MKVLYVARLFTGLERSVCERRWIPTGVPTIYRLIEALDAHKGNLSLLLCAKDGTKIWTEISDVELELEGLNTRVRVLAPTPKYGRTLGGVGRVLREMRHAWTTMLRIRSEKPDLVYIDHGNVWAAGLVARFFSTPVVFRVMGVYPAMRSALEGHGFVHRYLRWCYRAPYAAVICTQDGSGIEPWLTKAIRQGVPVHALLNGVDHQSCSATDSEPFLSISPDKTVVTFLGKLEDAKGAAEFATGFLSARRQQPDLHALIIGTGSLNENIVSRFTEAGAMDSLTLLQRLPHRDVLKALRRTDIYVSLNRLGNLSNANLEAMSVGLCMIVPSAQSETGVDLITERILPEGTVRRIRSVDDAEGLVSAIVELAADSDCRARMARLVRTQAMRELSSWPERIDREMSVLRNLAERKTKL